MKRLKYLTSSRSLAMQCNKNAITYARAFQFPLLLLQRIIDVHICMGSIGCCLCRINLPVCHVERQNELMRENTLYISLFWFTAPVNPKQINPFNSHFAEINRERSVNVVQLLSGRKQIEIKGIQLRSWNRIEKLFRVNLSFVQSVLSFTREQ